MTKHGKETSDTEFQQSVTILDAGQKLTEVYLTSAEVSLMVETKVADFISAQSTSTLGEVKMRHNSAPSVFAMTINHIIQNLIPRNGQTGK